MSDTKACNLTEREIMTLIASKMQQTINTNLNDLDLDDTLERINYLNRRLKTFKEPEVKEEAKTVAEATGWGSTNNG